MLAVSMRTPVNVTTPPPPCPTCGGLGTILEGGAARRCGCVQERYRARLLAGAGVPSRYLTERPLPADLATWGAERPRRGVALVGGVGTGKSTAAGGLLRRAVLGHGLTARWVPVGSWLVECTLARRRDDVAPPTPAELAAAELLVLDDLGAGGELLGPSRELLEDLIGRLYDAERVLLVTTNQAPAALGPMVGPRVASRLAALTEPCWLVGADRRRAA